MSQMTVIDTGQVENRSFYWQRAKQVEAGTHRTIADRTAGLMNRSERDPSAAVAAYAKALTEGPLDFRTQRSYLRRVSEFLIWLSAQHAEPADAVSEFRSYLESGRRNSPRSVALSLRAIAHFHRLALDGTLSCPAYEIPDVGGT